MRAWPWTTSSASARGQRRRVQRPAPYKPVVKPKLFSLDVDAAKGTLKIICGVEVTSW